MWVDVHSSWFQSTGCVKTNKRTNKKTLAEVIVTAAAATNTCNYVMKSWRLVLAFALIQCIKALFQHVFYGAARRCHILLVNTWQAVRSEVQVLWASSTNKLSLSCRGHSRAVPADAGQRLCFLERKLTFRWWLPLWTGYVVAWSPYHPSFVLSLWNLFQQPSYSHHLLFVSLRLMCYDVYSSHWLSFSLCLCL